MTWTECPSCAPNGVECYEHGPEDVDLARALAAFFQGKEESDADQVGWFMTDASVLRNDAGPGPYTLITLEQGWHNEHAFILNNLIVVLGEGGKDCPATPEVVAKLPVGVVVQTTDSGVGDGPNRVDSLPVAEKGMKSTMMQLWVIVQGHPAVIEVDADQPLRAVIPLALSATRHDPTDWPRYEARTGAGALLDLTETLTAQGVKPPPEGRIFLNLRAGTDG